MSETNNVTNTSTVYTARCKWFNNRAGFGFLTVVEGDKKDEDIFVHHSGVCVNDEQYKYLVQGEYVNFQLITSDNSKHPYQAHNITGIAGGALMCETRNDQRQSQLNYENSDKSRVNRNKPRHNNNKWHGKGKYKKADEWVMNNRNNASE